MKCPNCGAEVGNNKFCEYCGSQISVEMQKEQEQLNKKTCPKCGSTNISYSRENQGEIRGKNSKQIVHRTVALCKDCGETWFADEEVKKKKTWLWVLGWLFIFPVPLTILLLRKKDMNKILKYGIIAVAWILYLALAFSGGSSDTSTDSINNQNAETTSSSVAETIDAKDSSQELKETVKKAIDGAISHKSGEKIKDVTFEDKELTVFVDLSEADDSKISKHDIALSRIDSITDDILALDETYYDIWDKVIIDFGEEGKAVLDKSMVKDDGFGKYFDHSDDILK